MGVLADIYVGREDGAALYDAAPGSFADRAQYKTITPLELSTLCAIVRGMEWEDAMMDEFACVYEADDGERMIHRLPAAMVADLCGLAPDRMAAVTAAWAKTEELDWAAEDVRPVVEDLVRLARLAAESGRNVYLWNCV